MNRHQPFVLSPSCKPLGVVGHDSLGRRLSGFNQAGVGNVVGALADQHGRYVLYEILFNHIAFDFIRGKDDDRSSWLFCAVNLPARSDAPLLFPAGSMVVKAAWRQFRLPADRGILSRYYTRMARVINPEDGSYRTVCVGLVGLHIAHRTATNREWIWSTFEHLDTVNSSGRRRSTLNDPAGSQDPNDFSNNALLPVVDDLNGPSVCPASSQVVRVRKIHDSTVRTNAAYQLEPRVAASVLRYYQLVMTQWSTDPAADDDQFKARFQSPYPGALGSPFPDDFNSSPSATSIANVTMETNPAYQRSNSCMNCHHTPVKPYNTGLSWTLAKRAFPALVRP